MNDTIALRSALAAAEDDLNDLINAYVASGERKTEESRLLLIFGGHATRCGANTGPTCTCDWPKRKLEAKKWLHAHQDPDDKLLKIIIAGLIENKAFLKKIFDIVLYRRLLQKDHS